MSEDCSYKTVFVLDHTQYFGISAENLIDLDFLKNKINSTKLPPISKSLWTYSVEASVEYCRIVWDLFPTTKLVRFIVSDTAAHIVNTWNPNTQNLMHILNAMSMVGIPPRRVSSHSGDFSVIHGLRAAIEALSEPTDQQSEILLKNEHKIQNQGRVICVTSARDNASMKSLEDILNTVLSQQNSIANNKNDFLPINFCHLVIINLIPANVKSLVSNRTVREISSYLSSEVHSVFAAEISNKLTNLILVHYKLASTIVTGIPMKEEQNASSSANYDVEIFHAEHAHTVFTGLELVLPTTRRDGAEYDTVTLKWCTPRGVGGTDLQHCIAQHRVTPVDVTSRPSSCLINFLLNGRSVLLEMPRKTGGKLTSHLLSAHGGEIFIHTLYISRSCIEDSPSISEGIGGRVTDYRISDFGTFMQEHKLLPLKASSERPLDHNLKKTRLKLQHRSKYWPLTFGTTIIYNIRQFLDQFFTIITKPDLNENEVLQCKQNIFNLASLTMRHEQFLIPNIGYRVKGHKKEEQYRHMWSELEFLVKNSGNSAGHKSVLQCVSECRIKNFETSDKKDYEQSNIETNESPSRSSVIRAIIDSPMSPPNILELSIQRPKKNFSSSSNRSLLDIITSLERGQQNKRLEFSGRLCASSGQSVKLYPFLIYKDNVRETDNK